MHCNQYIHYCYIVLHTRTRFMYGVLQLSIICPWLQVASSASALPSTLQHFSEWRVFPLMAFLMFTCVIHRCMLIACDIHLLHPMDLDQGQDIRASNLGDFYLGRMWVPIATTNVQFLDNRMQSLRAFSFGPCPLFWVIRPDTSGRRSASWCVNDNFLLVHNRISVSADVVTQASIFTNLRRWIILATIPSKCDQFRWACQPQLPDMETGTSSSRRKAASRFSEIRYETSHWQKNKQSPGEICTIVRPCNFPRDIMLSLSFAVLPLSSTGIHTLHLMSILNTKRCYWGWLERGVSTSFKPLTSDLKR